MLEWIRRDGNILSLEDVALKFRMELLKSQDSGYNKAKKTTKSSKGLFKLTFFKGFISRFIKENPLFSHEKSPKD